MAKKRAAGKTSPTSSPPKPTEQVRVASDVMCHHGWDIQRPACLSVQQGDSQTQLSSLRDEGNKFFGKKDYSKALECYDKALKLIPATHQDKPLLHSNKAACHMMAKK